MSMTVEIAMKGITELDLLLSALQEMGKKIDQVSNASRRFLGVDVFALVSIEGRHVGFKENKTGEIEIVGDEDWRIVKQFGDQQFQQKLKQQYSVASVKRKAEELSYSVSSVSTQADGSIKIIARAWR